MPAIIVPDTEGLAETAAGDVEADWLCAWCHNRVASDKNRHLYHGKGEFIFFNPDGVLFEILTFSRTLGCVRTGEPTLEHTWFVGHAWSYCQCQGCGQHLGWYYAGLSDFVGLIKSRIARALYTRN
jgi:hypothetical protein